MATVPQYLSALRQRQMVISRRLGAALGLADKQSRVLNKSLLILLAVLIKTLVDKGVVTDAELAATLDAARDAAYAEEPTEVIEEVE